MNVHSLSRRCSFDEGNVKSGKCPTSVRCFGYIHNIHMHIHIFHLFMVLWLKHQRHYAHFSSRLLMTVSRLSANFSHPKKKNVITANPYWAYWLKYLLPHLCCEHGFHTPSRAKDVQGLGETVVIYEASVDGEQAHHQDDVSPLKERIPDLCGHTTQLSYTPLKTWWHAFTFFGSYYTSTLWWKDAKDAKRKQS